MDDETWRRHANPWSVYTRLAVIPAMFLAVWSRIWLGWWSLVPVTAVAGWLWINPHIFSAVAYPENWAAKGIYDERIRLLERSSLPPSYHAVLRWLIILALCSLVSFVWGLIWLLVWPAIFGGALIVLAQLWRMDRLGLFYVFAQQRSGKSKVDDKSAAFPERER